MVKLQAIDHTTLFRLILTVRVVKPEDHDLLANPCKSFGIVRKRTYSLPERLDAILPNCETSFTIAGESTKWLDQPLASDLSRTANLLTLLLEKFLYAFGRHVSRLET